MKRLYLDFETKSRVNLRTEGLDLYARSAEVLMLAWAIDDGPVNLWLPSDGAWRLHFGEALHDPNVQLIAWNAPFERAIFKHALGIDLPMSRWLDPKMLARYADLPSDSLEGAGKYFNLSADFAKLADGKRLIHKFCIPGKSGDFVQPSDAPEDWARFCEYCKQDVIAERELLHKLLPTFTLPEREEKLRILDAAINERGLPVDLRFCSQGSSDVAEQKDLLNATLRELTGLANPNAWQQLLPWLKARGYPFNSIGEKFAKRALALPELNADVRAALELRAQTGKSSTSKLASILKRVSPDARLRYAYRYYGAHTGRWSGEGVQPQNLTRLPVKIGTVELNVRSAFRAPAGQIFNVCDLSQIEVRVLAWLAQCSVLINFYRGFDTNPETPGLYETFASEVLYQTPIDQVTKLQRQIAKSAVLGAGYGIGGGTLVYNCCAAPVDSGKHRKWCVDKDGDTVRSGLWGYAQNMGIEMLKEDAHEAVRAFRTGYPEIPQCWYGLEDTVRTAILRPGTLLNFGVLKIGASEQRLVVALPSGRRLHYLNPKLSIGEWPDGAPKQNITFDGAHGREATYGGKLVENVVQAIARDVLAEGMLRAEAAGLTIVGHTHDEIITLGAADECDANQIELIDCMTKPMPWAPDLPLGADGEPMEVYSK